MVHAQLRWIAFVSAHYAELRSGVARAILAPFLIVAGMSGEFAGSWTGFILITGLVLLSQSARRWMDHRFGRVVSGANQQRLVMLVCATAYFVTVRLDRHAIGAGRPSLLFLAASVYALWLCVRLWPHAFHNLLPLMVAAGAAAAFTGVSNREEFLAWERHAYVYTLLAWSVAGMIDCALLMKALPHRGAEPVDAGAS